MSPSTYELRVLMCPQCGAPADVPDAGGNIDCGYCSANFVVRPRMVDKVVIEDVELDPSLGPEEREAARMQSLRVQADNYNTSNPYSFYDAPAGLEYLSGVNELDASVATMAQQAFRTALTACPERRGSIQQQRAVYWLAKKVKNIWSQRDDTTRARATIHAAHETLSDPGYLHLLRTALADLARYEDDLEGARQWLARCDPAPPLLDLDTSYRTSLAILLTIEDKWEEVLALVGEGRDEIPYEPSSIAIMHSLRIECFERLGRSEEAETELRWLVDDSPVPVDFLRTMVSDSPTYEAFRQVWERVESQPSSSAASSPSIDIDAIRSPDGGLMPPPMSASMPTFAIEPSDEVEAVPSTNEGPLRVIGLIGLVSLVGVIAWLVIFFAR